MTLQRLATAALLATLACGNTKVARQWSDPALHEGAFAKTLVLVLGTPFNRRQTAEEHFAAELARQGADAVRSWDVLPQEALDDRAELLRAVETKKADAVLVVRVVGRQREQELSEGREQWVPIATGFDYYGYVTTQVALYRKPDINVIRTWNIEVTLWDVASRKLVWSAETSSTTANETITTGELTDNYAGVVAKRVTPYLRRR